MRMENILSDFSDIIVNQVIEKHVKDDHRVIFEARLYLKDTTQLAVKDIKIFLAAHASKRKYAYQWMDVDNQLIIRWDNAQYHPELENFPYHKHLRNDKNVFPAPEVTLYEILTYIKEQIEKS